MQCLWLTWIDPAPEHDGQRIYSGRLLDATAAAGVSLDVLCFSHAASSRPAAAADGPIQWQLVPQEERPAWQSFFSRLPNLSHRCDTRAMREALHTLLRKRRWDTIVLEGLSSGWALDAIHRHYASAQRPPRLIHVSHNHEETTRALVARNYTGNLLMSALLKNDARKATRLERRMIEEVDLVTAVTQADAELFRARIPRKSVDVLSPGYGGRRLPARRIDATAPRRALLVGSFEWLAKQMNLREFLSVADPIFAAAGCMLQIVGNGEEAFFRSLRPVLRATEIVGPVERLDPYFDNARLAVLPERSGGGFKLKLLDYVFNRLPIAALENTIAGVPLKPGESILTFSTHERLAHGLVDIMDDFRLLNELQENAYAACEDMFDWSSRGKTLFAAMKVPHPGASEDQQPAGCFSVAAAGS